MLGWELSPHHSGGLGVACRGLLSALSKSFSVTFILPFFPHNKEEPFRIISAFSSPSISSSAYLPSHAAPLPALHSLFSRVREFTKRASELAKNESFDIIHAHDWLTLEAGIKIKRETGKPLVAHIHATEFDRTGGTGANSYVYTIEQQGMQKADLVIAVSNYTKQLIVKHYGIPQEKITVVHNAIDTKHFPQSDPLRIAEHSPLIAFVGRLTLQKGVDYFLRAAKRVLEFFPRTTFVVAGTGDMELQLVRQAIDLGISQRVIFTGFLSDEEIRSIMEVATVTVMPSVSEPFGIVPLESLVAGTPVIISKQSGVSEVLAHALKIDFWDVEEIAHNIMSVLSYPALHKELAQNGRKNALARTWNDAAQDCINAYHSIPTYP